MDAGTKRAIAVLERERREYMSQAKELMDCGLGGEASACYIEFARDLRCMILELKKPAKKVKR